MLGGRGLGIVLKKTEDGSISHILQIQQLAHWSDEAGGCLRMAHGKCTGVFLWLLVIDSGMENKHKLGIFPAVLSCPCICIGLVALEAMDGMTSQSLGLLMCVPSNSLCLATTRSMSHPQEWVSHLHHNLRLNNHKLEITAQHQHHHHKEIKLFEERERFIPFISSRGHRPIIPPAAAPPSPGVFVVLVVSHQLIVH